ncbi:MAG: hypothetical protein N2248_07190 [candidate division WOR-3 bacterium]|uniref:Uncharacterized protein n=1 Tax=candidate division WOR-3 bacterium TaxID=2052148 RepID=A0A7C3EUY3_UNCW3|nr:hypothetical protein [candidate division WOR-3 bacterium]
MAFVIYYDSELLPQLSSPAGKARAEWYGAGGERPLAFFDGTSRSPQITLPDSFYPVYRDMIDAARTRKTMLEMRIDSAAIDSSRLTVRLVITPTDSSADTITTLRLVAIVFEDSIPYYSILRADTFYSPMTVRTVIGDSFGIPLRLRFGQDYDTVLSTPVPDWNPNRTGIAVTVQNFGSRAVLQTAVKWRINQED